MERFLTALNVFFLVVVPVTIAQANSFGTLEDRLGLDFVPISSSTNPTPEQTIAGDLDGFGIVEYDYRIGVYEITNDQWNKFTASLGVPLKGTPTFAYNQDFLDLGTGTKDVPTNCVSWYEAAQFVNWLNTSTGHQAAYKFTGTQGRRDYTFDTWGVSDAWGGTNHYRHKDAYYFLPTEDEWFKAAYWNGTTIQDYATKAGDSLFQGNGFNGGWNYSDDDVGPDGPIAGPWDVGSGSEELNGTYDMMGNAWELMESPCSDPSYAPRSGRGQRSGYWKGPSDYFAASSRYEVDPVLASRYFGFRMHASPSPELSPCCSSA